MILKIRYVILMEGFRFIKIYSDGVFSLTSESQDAFQVYLLLSSRRSTINFASSPEVRGFRYRRVA